MYNKSMNQQDIMSSLEALSLASRLRRISDRIVDDVAGLYAQLDLPFNPRWFPYFYILKEGDSLAVADVAELLKVSHPTVIKFTNQMVKAGVLASAIDKEDRRRRLLTITPKGKELAHLMTPVWEKIKVVVDELVSDTNEDVFTMLNAMDCQLDKKPLSLRYLSRK